MTELEQHLQEVKKRIEELRQEEAVLRMIEKTIGYSILEMFEHNYGKFKQTPMSRKDLARVRNSLKKLKDDLDHHNIRKAEHDMKKLFSLLEHFDKVLDREEKKLEKSLKRAS